jgi:cell division protein FtsI/penicillin-binding protein 2
MNPTKEDLERQALRVKRAGMTCLACLLLVFGGLFARILHLKLHPPEELEKAAGEPFSSFPEMARRGDLLDRAGRIIATSSVGYRLFIDPQEVEDLQTIAVDIAHQIGGDPTVYDRVIAERTDSRYVVLSHLLDDVQVEAIRALDLRGVGLEPRLVRQYTSDEVGGILVGKVGFEHTGQAGMEHRFNEDLIPTDGRLTYLKDARGEPMWIEPAGYTPREDGQDIRLSLDLVIQEIAERNLREAVEQYNAGGGRAVVLDVQTGEILAMCDQLRARSGWTPFTTDPAREIHPSLGRNRCATDPYEPGSTFKPYIWSVATEMGKATLEEIIPTPSREPHYTSRGRAIRDVKYYGPVSWETVLVKSMNSGMSIVGERFTDRELQQTLARWGFGQKTGAGLPGETGGIVTQPREWTHYTQTSVPMGHEIGVTPLQMVQAFSAFCRDGTMIDLRLTAVRGGEERIPLIRRVLTPEIALLTRQTMRKVMTDGTGRQSQSKKYQLFGKSGTAQLPKMKGGGYYEDRYVSSFIAGAPLEQPRLIVLVVVDDPDRRIHHYGGIVAGPAARDIMDEALGYLGVVPDIEQETMSVALGE